MTRGIKGSGKAQSAPAKVRGGNGRVTGRTELIAVKGTANVKERFYALAKRDGLMASELMERALEAYEAATRKR